MAASFADLQQRTWDVEITVAAVKRVRRLVEIDLLDIEGTIRRLQGNVPLLCDVLYAVVKPQADAQGVSDEAFGEGLGGDVLDAAYEAFLEAWSGFFQHGPRERLRKAIEAGKRLHALVLQEQRTELERMDLDELVREEAAKRKAATQGPGGPRPPTGSGPSTSAPGSSVSTPVP